MYDLPGTGLGWARAGARWLLSDSHHARRRGYDYAVLPVVVLVCVLAAALGVWAVAFAVADRAVILRQLIAGGVVEAALVVQGVVIAVLQLTGTQLEDPVLLWGYLIVALIPLPGAAVVAFAERSRWSSVVLAVATLTVIAMQARIWQVWQL